MERHAILIDVVMDYRCTFLHNAHIFKKKRELREERKRTKGWLTKHTTKSESARSETQKQALASYVT